MDTRSRFAFVAGLVAVLLLVFALDATHKLPPASFKAFYCSGRTVLERANPYEIEPLRSCEQKVAPGALPSYAVEPAPLPGYAMAPWAALALLPPGPARALYYLILIAALALTSWAISKLSPLEPALALLALVSMWFLNLSFSEIPPIATACVVLSAVALARRRPWIAAAFAAGVALEPHLAVPMWIALFLFARLTRVPLVVVGLGLAVVDVAIGGPHQAVAYFTQVLPAQAASEIWANDQFSLTHLAVTAGIGTVAAMRLGLLSYLVMTVAGVVVGQRLAVRYGWEYLALVPTAFVLLGGSYVHDVQFYAALPLALVLLARAGRPNVAILLACALLAVAWSEATSRLMLVLTGISVFAVVWPALPKRPLRVAICGAAALAAIVCVLAINRLPAASATALPPSPAASAFQATGSAASDWGAYLATDRSLSTPSPRDAVRKLPPWAGTLILIGICLWELRRRPAPSAAVLPEIVDLPAGMGP